MYSLLLVDDEKDILEGYAAYFPWAEAGFTVAATASSGQEALSILRTQTIDLLVCDIEMPRLNGIKLVKELRASLPHLPVIVLSGYSDFEYARQMIELNIAAYVLKSDKHEVLLSALRKVAADLGGQPSGIILVDQAKAYIHRHLPHASLHGAADELHVSAAYLSRVFKEKAGINFQQYLLTEKMNAAEELLRRHVPVGEVSSRLGYADVQSFIRAFKNTRHSTPTSLLSSHKGGRK